MKNALAAVAAATLVLGGCAGESSRENTSNPSTGAVSSLDMKLTTPEGVTINTLRYTVSGGGLSAPRSADVNLTNSTRADFQVGNLNIANGYNIALAATGRDSQGDVPCAGNAPFNIENNRVTSVAVRLVCSRGNTVDIDDKGDLRVTVAVEVRNGVACPVVTGISALPLETSVGSTLQLEGFASQTTGLTYAWSGAGGTFGSASAAATAFTCGTAGDHDLTFTATPASPCSPSSYAVTVTCTGSSTTPPDAGIPDATITPEDATVTLPDATLPDATLPDATLPDATLPDATLPDATLPDAQIPSVACRACVTGAQSPCRDWLGIDNYTALCLENPDPQVAQLCTQAWECSMRSADNCARNVQGASACFCGNSQDLTACFRAPTASTPNDGPKGNCIAEFYAATRCAVGDLTCVETNFVEPSRPSYAATFLTQCATSAEGCGASCPAL